MIQRIQSVYLLAVSIITALMFFFPFISATQGITIYNYNFNGFQSLEGELVAPVYTLCGLIVVCLLISFVSIFFYKKRVLQIRLNVLNIILFLFIYVVEIAFFFILKGELKITNYSVQISSIFPTINIILTYLAIRAIGADEALVKSLNRLRN